MGAALFIVAGVREKGEGFDEAHVLRVIRCFRVGNKLVEQSPLILIGAEIDALNFG